MNLDLNLGPVGPTSPTVGAGLEPSLVESMNVDRLEPPLQMRIRQALRQGTRRRLRWRRLRVSSEDVDVDSDGSGNGNPLVVSSGENVNDGGGSGTSQLGEGSVAVEERSCEVLKTCEHTVSLSESDSVQEKENVEKIVTGGGSFFDCNICFDLAKEPIVTCCGHLFCWSCIYRWLEIHSDAKECPVCKGEVTLKNVTPIYGRGNHTHDPEEDLAVKIPVRPSGKRVESLRQTIQRTSSSFPMEEMIRRLGARFELTRDFIQRGDDGDSLSDTRALRLNRILTMSTLHRQRAQRQLALSTSLENVVDLTQDTPEVVPQRLPNMSYRIGSGGEAYPQRSPLVRSEETHPSLVEDSFPNMSYRIGSEGEAYPRRSPLVRSEEMHPSLVEDRDSFSSIAAVIHGESQNVDTNVEIDSLGSLSISSSIRRLDASRGSDMDSGDSRARRRRLN